LPATLVAITIALYAAVAVHSPAILVAFDITLLPLPSLSPATLITVVITLAALALSLFVICQPHRRCHLYPHCHRPPPSMPSCYLLEDI
jgi:hypothetical protein